jgi:predicted PurR-regulated permease PerM
MTQHPRQTDPPPPPAIAASRELTPRTEAAPASPRWGVFTKFLVSLILVVLLGALLVRFQQMIAPVVLSVILAYVLRPVVETISTRTGLSWSATAAIVYLLLLVVIITLLTVAGFALVQQVQGLYAAVLAITEDPSGQLEEILSQPVRLGPFIFDLSQPFMIGPFGPFQSPLSGDWQPLLEQAFNAIQPALSRLGNVISSFASGTVETLGWLVFILVASFYLLNDLRSLGVSIERVVPEGYEYDVRRLVNELGPIWNAFLRGQITLAIVMGLVVGVTMWVLGVRYPVVLGLLAGLLEFIPIIGPLIAGTVAVLVALFQPMNWFGLNPVTYAIVILVASVLLQQIENNFLVPRILGGSLNLHPVVILVGALIAANLAGIIGLLLSAPVMATLRLIGQYIYRKMFDLDPWPTRPARPRPPAEVKWARWLRKRLSTLGSRRADTQAAAGGGPPRVEYSYTIYWTKQVRTWETARREAVQAALAEVLAQPSFEDNAYERRYSVAGLDEQAHAGASLMALRKVLEAFAAGEASEEAAG